MGRRKEERKEKTSGGGEKIVTSESERRRKTTLTRVTSASAGHENPADISFPSEEDEASRVTVGATSYRFADRED